MNQRNATPENGIRFKPSATVRAFVSSHAPGSLGSAGTEARRIQKAPNTESENRMPATAAALGVFRLARVTVSLPAISVFLPSLLKTLLPTQVLLGSHSRTKPSADCETSIVVAPVNG